MNINLTVMCLIYKDNQILIQYRTKKDWPGITFPGGHVEINETCEQAVIREIFEETGLLIKNPVLVGKIEWLNNNSIRELSLLYKTNVFSGQLISSDEGKNIWIYKKEINKNEFSLDFDKIFEIYFPN